MCLVVSITALNPDNSSSVYVSIQLLNGERDDQLNWPITVLGGRCVPPRIAPKPPYFGRISRTNFRMCGLKQLKTVRGETILSCTNLVNDCHVFNVTWYTNCTLEVELQSIYA